MRVVKGMYACTGNTFRTSLLGERVQNGTFVLVAYPPPFPFVLSSCLCGAAYVGLSLLQWAGEAWRLVGS